VTNPIVLALTGECSCPSDRVTDFQTIEQGVEAVLNTIADGQIYWFVHVQGYHVLAVGPHERSREAVWKDSPMMSGNVTISKGGAVVKKHSTRLLSHSGVKEMVDPEGKL